MGAIAAFDLPIPQAVTAVPDSTGQPVKQTLYSMDCLLTSARSALPFIYFRFMIGLVLPITYVLAYAAVSYLLDIIKKRPLKPTILITAFIFQFVFLQPDLVLQMLSILSCRKVGSSYFMIADMNQKCYTTNFFKYGYTLILPILVLFMFGVPYLLFRLLKRNWSRLMSYPVRVKYGFLYKEYRQKIFYWEFVKMGEKLLIMFFLVYYTEFIKIKGILVFLTILFYSIFQKLV